MYLHFPVHEFFDDFLSHALSPLQSVQNGHVFHILVNVKQ